jgi:hypothetical protein
MQFYQLKFFACSGYADLFASLFRRVLTSMGSWRIISNTHPTSFEFFHLFFHFPLAHVVIAMQDCSHPLSAKIGLVLQPN